MKSAASPDFATSASLRSATAKAVARWPVFDSYVARLAVPIPDPTVKRKRIMLQGDVPNPIRPPSGCHFHTRCPIARPDCSQRAPVLEEKRSGHWAACHYRD